MSKLGKFRRTLALTMAIGLGSLSLPTTKADEGMWTFDNPPLKQLKEKYNFEPSKEWLDHVRLSSVRLNDGGSGSFISPDGLVMTNHHVASGQLAKLSTEQRDLLKTGFYARTLSEELPCPDLEMNVLVSLENVTEKIQKAAAGAPDDKTANERRKAEIAKIEKESTEATKLRCNVVQLYQGGEYWLYQYKKYTDLRLVFAPEKDIAFFGGDPDNFTYPRYNLDVTFLRAYEDGKPAKVKHYFKWNEKGPQNDELVFVAGHPGSTDRLETVAQLEYQRDVSNPLTLKLLGLLRSELNKFGSQGPEQQRRAQDLLFGIENSLKAIGGEQEGLLDPKVIDKKRADEQELRRRVAENSELQKAYGAAWDQLAEVYKKSASTSKRFNASRLRFSRMAGIATTLSRYASEIKKPNNERLAAYRDSNLESLKFSLLSRAPIYSDLEETLIRVALENSLSELGSNDPFVEKALGGRTPAEVAKELIQSSKLADLEYRKKLLEGGSEEIEKSNDPLLVLVRKVDPITRQLQKQLEEELESTATAAGEKIAKARFAVYGKTIPPDATFTLRLSYGTVKGYEQGTTFIPYKTTFHGLFDRASSFDGKSPFNLPERVLARKNSIDLDTPFNFVCTTDIIGGNSGSPVFNKNAEIVGLIFDGNIQSLLWNYQYTDSAGRAVAVHSQGMIEALRKIYDATPLVDEILGKNR